jgi:hypothetical protein
MANFYGNARTAPNSCTLCPNGGELSQQSEYIIGSVDASTKITNCGCPVDSYATNGVSSQGGCTKCPAGLTTQNLFDGSTPGSNRNAGDCSACADGYYGNGATCTRCPATYILIQKDTNGGKGSTNNKSSKINDCKCPDGTYNTECYADSHNCYACISGPPPAAKPPSSESNKKTEGSKAGAIVGSILGVLAVIGIGYYCYSQKQAEAMSAAETSVEIPNKF